MPEDVTEQLLRYSKDQSGCRWVKCKVRVDVSLHLDALRNKRIRQTIQSGPESRSIETGWSNLNDQRPQVLGCLTKVGNTTLNLVLPAGS